MSQDFSQITRDVAQYYTGKIRAHGATHLGVDWNSEASQEERYRQLTSVIDRDANYSLLDWGCGYGGLADYLTAAGDHFQYTGYDVSDAMVEAARARAAEGRTFTQDVSELKPTDYVVGCGLFSVKGDVPDDEWTRYVEHTIDQLAHHARRGFSFNMLTSYSDVDRMRPDLHYADPARYFDLCKRRYSRQVALLHDYGIWEFTIRVTLEQ